MHCSARGVQQSLGCWMQMSHCRTLVLSAPKVTERRCYLRHSSRRSIWLLRGGSRSANVQRDSRWKWPLLVSSGVASILSLSSARSKGDADVKTDSRYGNNEASAEDIANYKLSQSADNRPSGWGGLGFLHTSIPISELSSIISSWSWPESLSSVQSKFSALMLELGRGPGSLYSEIVNEPPDLSVHPECQWDADVRLGDELCISERAFLSERRRRMKGAFASLFGVKESEVDERDLPIVAIAGSGGGYRAMINTTSSLAGAQQCGILDCVTYTSGISGSCWALGALYSGVAGSTTPQEAVRHILDKVETSYLDMSTLDMLITSPTHKYLLYGLLRKASSSDSSISLTDLFGTLVSARLFVPRDISKLDPRHLSLSHFRHAIDDGSLPLPIFMAVRHEVPLNMEGPLSDAKAQQNISVDSNALNSSKRDEAEIEQQSTWLWFEFTPYEVGCDELGAWVPSWAFGRRFKNGKSIDRNPETSLSILNGIYASAFCASLQHYFIEIQPLLRQLPAPLYAWLDEIISENKKELGLIHPVLPNELPNYVKGLAGQLRRGSPPDITERDTLDFMDAGAELNIPYYPLFRRDVDCVIALDASADSQDLWFTRAEQYAARRGLSRWPKGARWPVKLKNTESGSYSPPPEGDSAQTEGPVDPNSDAANRALAEAQEREVAGQASKRDETEGRDSVSGDVGALTASDHTTSTTSSNTTRPKPSSTIWIGSSAHSSSSTASLMDSLEEQDLLNRDGIAIVYNPLVPNESVAPGFDPMSISTWVVRMDKEEAETLGRVAEANFLEGKEKTVKLLKAIWMRKRNKRLEAEEKLHQKQDELALHPLAYHP